MIRFPEMSTNINDVQTVCYFLQSNNRTTLLNLLHPLNLGLVVLSTCCAMSMQLK